MRCGRGRWQFSLRQLLLGVTVVALLLSLYEWTMTVEVGPVSPDARVADRYFGFIEPEMYYSPLTEKDLRPRNIARVSGRFFPNGSNLLATLYRVDDGSAAEMNSLTVGASSTEIGNWFGHQLRMTFALGDLDTPDGRVTSLGSVGHTAGGSSAGLCAHKVKSVAHVLVPGRVGRGEANVVYAEGDQPPIVESGMSIDDFARANPGSYLVVTMCLE
jgi:hypothetical protein